MSFLILWLPLILRILSALTGVVGLVQANQVHTGSYSASPVNIGMITAWLGTSGASLVASFFAQPTTWTSLKKALDVVFTWVHAKIGLDPANATDIDERTISWLEDEIISLLQSLVARWVPGESQDKAIEAIDQIRQSRAAARSAVAIRSAKAKG